MKERVIVILILGLCVCGLAGAAIYDWTGAAGDGNWNTPANWLVTGSNWTWPNEEFGDAYTNRDSDEIRIVNGDVVTRATDLYDGSNAGNLILDNRSTLILGDDVWMAAFDGNKGQIDVLGGSLLDLSDDLMAGYGVGSVATLNIIGSTFTNGDMFYIGYTDGSVATLNVIGSTFSVGGELRVGYEAGAVGYMNIVDSDVSFGGHLKVADHDGSTGYLYIGGNSTVSIGSQFYMNDDGGSSMYSELLMDGGAVTTVANTYFNDDGGAGSEAYVWMNGGTWNSGGMIAISWNANALSHLTMNGGEMIAGAAINLGVDAGGTGESRIFFNDGLLQGEALNFNMTDSKIIFSDGWGKLKINSSAVNEAAMQAFIDSGNIDVSALNGYTISTDSGYTVLTPVPGVAGIVSPLAGASGVAVDTILEWLSPEAYVQTGFRVYFGDDPNDQSPGGYGNNEIVSGDNVNEIDPAGDLEYSTTYYWRVDVLEPNSPYPDVVRSGRRWHFTTESDTPVILTHPVNQFVDDGADADFTVVATTPQGRPNTFEWFVDPNAVQIVSDGSKYTIVSDDATSTLTIHGAAGDDEGRYYCRVTNDGANYVYSRSALLALNKLLGYWPLDEGTGLVAADVVGGNDGTLEAGVNWVTGVLGSAMETNVESAGIRMSPDPTYLTPYMSMSCWAITEEASWDNWSGIVGHFYDTGSTEAGWGLYEDGTLGRIEFYASQGGAMVTLNVTGVATGVWNHYVGTVSDTEIALYLNGVLVDSTPFAGGVDYNETPGGWDIIPTIGVYVDDDENDYFNGSVDEVRIYNYAVDAYTVAELYYDGSGKFTCVDPPAYDVTDDCVVDLADVAAVAALWAECGRHPSSYCP